MTRVSGRRVANADVQHYEREGFVFPFRVLDDSEVTKFRTSLEQLEAHVGGVFKPGTMFQPHLSFRWAYDLATRPSVLDVIERFIGPNILVHTSSIFSKHPGAAASVAWHQDGYYWKLDSPRLVTAWIALSDSAPSNGCLRVVPRSHLTSLPHVQRAGNESMLSSGLSVEVDAAEPDGVDIVLRAGEMSLHHLNAVHGSDCNRSNAKRIGFAVRYVAPEVRQALPHHAVILARGSDEHHHYEHLDEAPSDDIEEGLASVARLGRWILENRARNAHNS
jgi:hypothetical protein